MKSFITPVLALSLLLVSRNRQKPGPIPHSDQDQTGDATLTVEGSPVQAGASAGYTKTQPMIPGRHAPTPLPTHQHAFRRRLSPSKATSIL